MASRIDEQFLERRDGARNRAVLALGKIVHAGRERICIVRDVSAGGLKVEMTDPPEPGSYVIVEMLGLNPCPARVAWRLDHQAGLAFTVLQDVERLCRRGRAPGGILARGPRFTIDRPAVLRAGGQRRPIRVVNVSVGGARLQGVRQAQPHAPGRIELAGGAISLAGYTRWVLGDEAGFSFSPPLDLPTLLKAVECDKV